MKKLSIIIFLLFFTIFCMANTYKEKAILTDSGGKGGNPEVKNINHCFKLKTSKKNECFNIFYPNDINITIYPSNGETIRLAGRKSSIEKREFTLQKQERFILYLDISNVECPIQSNIQTAKLLKDGRTLTVDIAVKDISDKVILYDKNHRVLLEYTIKR